MCGRRHTLTVPSPTSGENKMAAGSGAGNKTSEKSLLRTKQCRVYNIQAVGRNPCERQAYFNLDIGGKEVIHVLW